MGYPADYSSIAAPMHIGEQALGLITLAHPTYGRYGSEAAAMTSTFASYAGSGHSERAPVRSVTATGLDFYRSAPGRRNAPGSKSIDELLSTTTRLIPLLIGVKQCGIFVLGRYQPDLYSYFLVWPAPHPLQNHIQSRRCYRLQKTQRYPFPCFCHQHSARPQSS